MAIKGRVATASRFQAPVCCGQSMEGFPGPQRWDLMDFSHEDFIDYECLACGKTIEGVPA